MSFDEFACPVVYRDDDLLIVDKPSGMPTTAPSRGDVCLVRWVEETFPGLWAHPTSRLDSLVSGLVTFALSKAVNRRLLDARRAGTYKRVYLGITLHTLDEDRGMWTWPISIDPRSAKRRVAGQGQGAREARTVYEVTGHTPHASMLRLRPRTGRTHQLRVHASTAGAPLFGDLMYGGERRFARPDGTVVTARRVMLHCAEVSFPWPTGQKRFTSPLPYDMRQVWLGMG
jgi:23S rRNA-/tRNA-specific pseudouridylate synthase